MALVALFQFARQEYGVRVDFETPMDDSRVVGHPLFDARELMNSAQIDGAQHALETMVCRIVTDRAKIRVIKDRDRSVRIEFMGTGLTSEAVYEPRQFEALARTPEKQSGKRPKKRRR